MTEELYALLQYTVQSGASDLHLSEDAPPVIRVNGELRQLSVEELQREGISSAAGYESPAAVCRPHFRREDKNVSSGCRESVTKNILPWTETFLTPERRRILETKGETDFAWDLPDGQRFRINIYQCGGRMSAALRVIPRRVPSCKELDLPEGIRAWAHLQSGLVLVTGATGSGKSTTLAAILQEINLYRPCHILTLEDPIEYRFEPARSLIHQREVGTDTGSFASGLRAALREDPDVIMVGELRDTETMAIAVTAAETGHLVFATLHTRSAAETADRIIDSFPEQQQGQIRVQLASTLQAVTTQQLLPGPDGKQAAAMEILRVTPAVRNLIREGKTSQIASYIQTGGKYGMQTMESAVERLKREGRIRGR